MIRSERRTFPFLATTNLVPLVLFSPGLHCGLRTTTLSNSTSASSV